MNVKQALAWAGQRLSADSARLDAEVLLAECLERNRTFLYTWPEHELSAEQVSTFKAWVADRENGKPVAYILGEKEFWSLPLWVSDATLIPRPETELLVELVLERCQLQQKLDPKILDLGTGTGAIAIALAKELPRSEVVALDCQAGAVALAQKNAARHSLSNLTVLQSHWFEAISRRFDVIVSNPPYIDSDDAHLAEGDVRFEPLSALVAEQNGLADLSLIIRNAPQFLLPNGLLLLEHGFAQADAVMAMLTEAGFKQVANHCDLAGLPRVSGGVIE